MNGKLQEELEKLAWIEHFVSFPEENPFTRKLVERLIRRTARGQILTQEHSDPEKTPQPAIATEPSQGV